MEIKVQETNKKDHYYTYLPEETIKQLKKRRINIIIEEHTEINSSKDQVCHQKFKYHKDVVILKKIVSFILNAFLKFLKGKQDPNTKNLENKIDEIKNLKKKAKQQHNSAQVKLEIKELKQLMEWQEGSLNFSDLFMKYLKSKELKSYIDENKKIKSLPTKQEYHKAVKLVHLEMQRKDKVFIKFISKNKSFQDIVLNEQEYESFDSQSQSFEQDSNNYSQQLLTRTNLRTNQHRFLEQ